MYYVNEENGYILSIQEGGGGTREISKEEYDAILAAILSRPEPLEGYDYRLKSDLEWELCELPAHDPDPEISDMEAMTIITGGDG